MTVLEKVAFDENPSGSSEGEPGPARRFRFGQLSEDRD